MLLAFPLPLIQALSAIYTPLLLQTTQFSSSYILLIYRQYYVLLYLGYQPRSISGSRFQFVPKFRQDRSQIKRRSIRVLQLLLLPSSARSKFIRILQLRQFRYASSRSLQLYTIVGRYIARILSIQVIVQYQQFQLGTKLGLYQSSRTQVLLPYAISYTSYYSKATRTRQPLFEQLVYLVILARSSSTVLLYSLSQRQPRFVLTLAQEAIALQNNVLRDLLLYVQQQKVAQQPTTSIEETSYRQKVRVARGLLPKAVLPYRIAIELGKQQTVVLLIYQRNAFTYYQVVYALRVGVFGRQGILQLSSQPSYSRQSQLTLFMLFVFRLYSYQVSRFSQSLAYLLAYRAALFVPIPLRSTIQRLQSLLRLATIIYIYTYIYVYTYIRTYIRVYVYISRVIRIYLYLLLLLSLRQVSPRLYRLVVEGKGVSIIERT